MNRKIVIDKTVPELKRAVNEILFEDEAKPLLNKLDKIDRDRTACDLAHHLKRMKGLRGQELEEMTLKTIKTVEKNYTKKPTINNVRHALYKTEYGRSVKKYTEKPPQGS